MFLPRRYYPVECNEVVVAQSTTANRGESAMGTLAGNKTIWGEEWGYDRASYDHFVGVDDRLPNREESEAGPVESPDSSRGLMSGLLLCALFWLLIGLAVVAWWMSRP